MIQRKPFLITLLFTFFSVGSISITFSQPSLFNYEMYVSDNGDTLKYRQLMSDYDPDSKYPLVIFLHGAGERGNDNEAQLKWGVMNFASSDNMKKYPSILIAPQCPRDKSWGNFSYDDMTRAVSDFKGKVKFEASGNMTKEHLLKVAKTGVDFVSIGALTKHIQAIDLSLRVSQDKL